MCKEEVIVQPDKLILKIGVLDINLSDYGMDGYIKFDGKDMEGINKLTVTFEHGKIPIAEMRFYPEMFKPVEEKDG